ncbi:MAG: energy transducer TonB [Pseudomonadota bacterium]|nr:energy transducer TonB [Pseudomonadota bacterium]
MYRANLDSRDRGGALAAVAAIHVGLLFALLNATGHIDVTDPQRTLRVFDINDPPPPPPEPVQQQQQQQQERQQPQQPPRPREEEGAASPRNIRSQATPVVAPRPRIALPLPVPMAVTETPNQGADPTQGASDVRGPGTGAGGIGTGTGSGGSGGGAGGGGGGGYVVPPRLLTPVLSGRDFPQQMLRAWPRGAPVFARIRVGADGSVIQCIVDRGTGMPAIDSHVCATVQARLRYNPARNASGQAVAGWSGYRQDPPQ